MSDVFSLSWSLNRGRYALAVFLKILPLALLANGLAYAYYSYVHPEAMVLIQAQNRAAVGEFLSYATKVSWTIFCVAFALWLNVAVKRLRNIWASTWLALLTFVPVINLFFFIYLLAVKGEDYDDYSYDDEAMPLGFKAMFALSVVSVGSTVLMLWLWHETGAIWAQLGPRTFTWSSAAMFYVAVWVLSGSVAYGIWKRKEWSYFAIMATYLFSIVLSSANYFFVSKNPEIMLQYYRLMNVPNAPAPDLVASSMATSTWFTIVVGIFFIIYVNKNLNYFTE